MTYVVKLLAHLETHTLLIRWCLQASHQCRRQLANKALFCGGFSAVFSCYQVICHLWFTSERACEVHRRKKEPNENETGLCFSLSLAERKVRHPCILNMTRGNVSKHIQPSAYAKIQLLVKKTLKYRLSLNDILTVISTYSSLKWYCYGWPCVHRLCWAGLCLVGQSVTLWQDRATTLCCNCADCTAI